MKVAQGDSGCGKNGKRSFYAESCVEKCLEEGVKRKKPVSLQTEQEKLLPNYKNDWNYGNAVQDTNQVLGLIDLNPVMLRRPRNDSLLLLTARFPQMNSLRPNMHLAKALLEKRGKGYRVGVLSNAAVHSGRWARQSFAAWTAARKKRRNPDFGANLFIDSK